MKHKCNDTVKGCFCADGYKQHSRKAKEETALPIIALVIETQEGHEVAVADLPGVSLGVTMEGEEELLMTKRGKLAELIVLICTKYIPQVCSSCQNWQQSAVYETGQSTLKTATECIVVLLKVVG